MYGAPRWLPVTLLSWEENNVTGIPRVSVASLDARDDYPEFIPAAPSPDGMFAGADETGTIRVRVDAAARVADLEIDGEWHRRVRPDGFAAALFGAYVNAAHQAMSAAHAARIPESARSGDTGRDRAGDGMRHRLEAALQGSREAARRLAQARTAPAPEASTAHGPHGYVTARGQAGSIVAIEADPDAIRHTTADRLRRDALAALRSAQDHDAGRDSSSSRH